MAMKSPPPYHDNNNNNSKPSDPLKDLLASLAAGVRAVNSLPVEDDYAYQASFPEFATALHSAQESLASLVLDMLQDQTDATIEPDTEDPFLLEQAADLCDLLMEQVEGYLAKAGGPGGQPLADLAQSTRNRSKKSFRTMMEGMMEMPKPQITYQLNVPDNTRGVPFIPKVNKDKPHGITPWVLTWQEGSGWDTRHGGTKAASSTIMAEDNMVVLPKQHVPHPYQNEIESFVYTASQMQSPLQTLPPLPMPKGPVPLPFTWISTPEALDVLGKRLATSVKEMAVDLEAHNYRSFAGFVCLMQISIRDEGGKIESFLVDTLKLHKHMNAAMADCLANPAIVKVFHGADSDIAWLQRDFGLYVVNLFDTGRAARALKFSSASYAHLLMRYFGIQADKSLQLADWRQRPLPAKMQEYAVQDTYYLLAIYDCLRWELTKHKETLIEEVLDTSRKVCLIRYAGEAFRPLGYQSLLGRGRGSSKTEHRLTSKQEAVLAALWDWRDQTARKLDESVGFILPNDSLWRLALAMPTTLQALQSLFQPLPPHLVTLSAELLGIIKKASSTESSAPSSSAQVVENDDDEEEDDDDLDEDLTTQQSVPSSSSAFFKPAPANERLRRGMMSPVLGTEALYKQAGWMTPQEVVSVVESSTTDVDEKEDGSGKPKRLLSVHAANAHFHAKQVSTHSLELSSSDSSRGRTADGMATIRVTTSEPSTTSPQPSSKVEEVVKVARQSSAQIRNSTLPKDAIPRVLGVLAQSAVQNEVDEEEDEEGPDGGENDAKVEAEEEDFVIPRSIREIYKISNRNRRNKKAFSPTPECGVAPTSEKEKEELAKAEALLKEYDAEVGYLFEQSSSISPKRLRTKSTGGSEEGSPAPDVSAPSKEEDLAFMRDVGWVKPHESNESILAQQYGNPAAAEEANKNPYYEYAPVAMSSAAAAANANPFFSGAALQGGALASSSSGGQKSRKPNNKSSGRGGQNRRQERPEKKDGRSFAYRGKR